MGTTHQSLHRTTNHEVIRAWAERRHGKPALVRTTSDALGIKLKGDEALLEEISWDKWFEIFDKHNMVFVYEDPGYMCKVVPRKEGGLPLST